MKSIQQSYAIHAPVQKIWQALIDPKIIDAWGGGPAVMDQNVGTHFSLWGGDIFGENTHIRKNNVLRQNWQEKGWVEPSIVTFSLISKNEITFLKLHQTNIPDERVADIADGWKKYYCGPLKEYVETH